MGSLAAKLLIDEIKYIHEDLEAPYKHEVKVLKTELKIRDSSVRKTVLAS
jgi:hypothetical protein